MGDRISEDDSHFTFRIVLASIPAAVDMLITSMSYSKDALALSEGATSGVGVRELTNQAPGP